MSLADAPETVVAEQKIDPAGQVPIKFELKIDPAVVQPNVNYALQARITVDDRLMFINDERYSVDPLKPEPAHLVLKMVKQDAGAVPAPLFGTNWVAEDIGGKGRHRRRPVDIQHRLGRKSHRARSVQRLFRPGRPSTATRSR